MNLRRIQIELAVLFICIARCDAQVSDITPPKLAGFEISPTTVDISTNAQTVTLTARIADDLSGFGWPDPPVTSSAVAFLTFRPSGLDGFGQAGASAMFRPEFRVSGTELDGIYTADLTIPTHSRTGTWTMSTFTLRDAVGNSAGLLAADVRALGFPISFTVTGVDDRNAPQVVSLSLEPTTVDTSATNQTITIVARIADDVSFAGNFDEFGAPIPAPAIISFVSPSRKQIQTAGLLEQQISGDDRDGVFRTTINLPQFSEPGVWRLSNLRVSDSAGNTQFIDLGTALAKGLAAEFTVTGAGDTNTPVLRAFNVSPHRIGLPTTNQTAIVTARYSDDLVGFNYFDFRGSFPATEFVQFQSPSQQQLATATLFPDATQFGPLDVVSSNTIVFPRFCETGVWTLKVFSLRDGLNNATNLDATAIRAFGFPTQIAVGISPSIAIARQRDSLLLSWPSWGSDFHLQSRDFGATSIWQPVNVQPSAIGEQMVVAVPLSTDSLLFRLIE